MKLSSMKRETVTIFAGAILAAVCFFYIYFAYIVGPLWRRVVTVYRETSAAKEEFRLLEAGTSNEEVLRTQHSELAETVKSLRGLFPSERELPSVIEFLSNLASKTQVKIQTIFPQRPMGGVGKKGLARGKGLEPSFEEADVYKEIPIQIDALAGYHQLGTFLSLIEEAGKPPMRLTTLRIHGHSKELKRHEIMMVVTAYFAVDEGAFEKEL